MMTTTTNMMDFEYYYGPEPTEIDATYITEESIDMDIENPSPSKKRRFTDVETHHDITFQGAKIYRFKGKEENTLKQRDLGDS